MKIFISSIILMVALQNVYSLDTNVVKYFPMKIGNVWIYHYMTTNMYNTNHYYRDAIDGSIVVGGHLYYRFLRSCRYVSGYPPCSSPTYYYFRIDSTNGRVCQYVTSGGCEYLLNNIILDSLQARLNDSVRSCNISPPVHIGICSDTSLYSMFGISKPAKYFVVNEFEHGEARRYIKDFGPVYYMSTGISGGSTKTLVGCVINGVVYGDTAFITGLLKISSEIPADFSLSQNYPNPFNPNTKIKFDIPLSRGVSAGRGVFVRLIVYDILGREVATLVNEGLKPGTYEIEWDPEKSGQAGLSSGVYFYKLITTGFSETRKMVLVK